MSFIEHTNEHDKSFLDVNKLKKGDLIYYRNDLLYFEKRSGKYNNKLIFTSPIKGKVEIDVILIELYGNY